MNNRKLKLIIILGWAVIALAGLVCATMVLAEDGVTLDLKDADIRSAIESLFRGTGKSFSLSPDVRGTVTMVVQDKTAFDVVLKTLLRQGGFVFRIDNGIYVISRKETTTGLAGMTGMAGGVGGMPGMGGTTGMPGVAATTVAVQDTTEKDMVIDKIPLNNMGATELLDMMSGNSNNNNNNSSGGMGGNSGSSGFGGGSSGGSSNRSSGSSNRSSGSSSRSSGSNRSSGSSSSSRSW